MGKLRYFRERMKALGPGLPPAAMMVLLSMACVSSKPAAAPTLDVPVQPVTLDLQPVHPRSHNMARLGPLSGKGAGVRRIDRDPVAPPSLQSGYEAVGGLPLDGRGVESGFVSAPSVVRRGSKELGPVKVGLMRPAGTDG